MSKQAGFSLIELTMVMAVLGVLLGSGLAIGTYVTTTVRADETEQKMKAIERAIYAFKQTQNRLPCPANITLAVTDTNFGREQRDTVTPANGCASVANQIFTASIPTVPASAIYGSMVPIRTLGLPDDYAYDGWGRRIFYAVNKDATRTDTSPFVSIFPVTNMDGGISIDSAGGTRTVTTYRVCTIQPSCTATTGNGAIYLLLSFGPNGHGAWPKAGGTTRLSAAPDNARPITNADELKNCHCTGGETVTATAYDNIFVQGDAQATDLTNKDTTSFDDVVRYTTPWHLQ